MARAPRAEIDFGDGPRPTIAVSWGDVATAWRSTAIPDIQVHFEAGLAMRLSASLPAAVRRLLGGRLAQSILKRLVERAPSGPSRERRETGRATIIGEAWSADGRHVAARLETPEPYALTVESALAIAECVRDGQAPSGFQTPATAFGPDFLMDLPGLRRMDLA